LLRLSCISGRRYAFETGVQAPEDSGVRRVMKNGNTVEEKLMEYVPAGKSTRAGT